MQKSDELRKQYLAKRERAAKQYQTLLAQNQTVRLQKSASNLFRERKGKAAKLDTKDFTNVINIDTQQNIAEVEAMATYRSIVAATLSHNRLPAVVPELATITVGGAVSGGGIEASSIYNGLVHETILAMDVLLPTGRIVTATPKNRHKDLFYGMANSFGTLGYILKLTIKLIPTKPYVALRHLPFQHIDDLLAVVQEVANTHKYNGEAVDFIDGSGFEKHNLYLTLANFTDQTPKVSNYRYMHPYFKSIQQKREDHLTTQDFIWRWDSDWFWCSKGFYMDRTLPRAVFGKWLLRSESYWKLLRLDQKYHISNTLRKLSGDYRQFETVIQDVQIPIERSREFWEFFTKHIAIRPVWFCPTRSDSAADFPLYKLKPGQVYINFGFWDQVTAHADDPFYYNKLIEAKVSELGGKKGLYSEAFYNKTEFWQLYGGPQYKALKASYDPQNRLKDLYQKCIEQA